MIIMYLSYFIISLVTNYILCLLFVLSQGARDQGLTGRKGCKGCKGRKALETRGVQGAQGFLN